MASAAPALSPRSRRVIVVACVVPFAIAVATTLLQVWPATIAIDWLTRDDGRFGLKAAIAFTFCLIGLALLAALIPIALVVGAVRRARRRRDGAAPG